MSEKVIEKLDAIEAAQAAKLEEAKAEALAKVEEAVVPLTEKLATLEAKISELGKPSIIKTAKSVREDVNKSVREQLKKFNELVIDIRDYFQPRKK